MEWISAKTYGSHYRILQNLVFQIYNGTYPNKVNVALESVWQKKKRNTSLQIGEKKFQLTKQISISKFADLEVFQMRKKSISYTDSIISVSKTIIGSDSELEYKIK